MSSLQFYVDHAIRECFGKILQRRNKYLRGDSISDPVRSVHFETQNVDLDGLNSDAIFGRIVYEDDQGKKYNGDSIMVKLMERSKIKYEFMDMVFSNEIYTYSKIIPFFAVFDKKIWNMFPKFYYGNSTFSNGSDIEDEMALVILEDLSVSGYRLTNCRTFLDIDELRLCVKKLAHFHAYSYYAKSKSPREFHSVVSNLVETHFSDTREKKGFMNITIDHHIDILSKDPRYTKKTKVIRRILEDADEFIRRIVTTALEPMAVVCHGDFLRNNIMFKYDSADHPVDVKFVDPACCRYCSPVIDLALVLYMNTDQSIRDLYWDELIDVYCFALQEVFPGNNVPCKNQVVKEFEINALNAFVLVSFFLPHMMRCGEIPNYAHTFTYYFLPEFPEFVHVPWHKRSTEAERVLFEKVNKPHHEKVVLDVLKDIIDRGFV